MTFTDEKLVLLLFSVLLSIIANRLLVFLDCLKDAAVRKHKAKKILPLFAADLKNAIVHNKYNVAEDSYKLLLSYYDSFSNDDDLSIIFNKLVGYYQFLKNDGYISTEARKEIDINEIDKIIAQANKGHIHIWTKKKS